MADLSNLSYSFDEDGILRLQKDLNYMFYNLDHKNVKRLFTEYCSIRSEEGETQIDGPLLLMTNKGSTTYRLKMGWDNNTSKFIFNIYDSTGGPSVELDSCGDAVFRGKLNTVKDAFIGERLFVGWGGTTNYPSSDLTADYDRGFFIIQPGTTIYLGELITYQEGTSDYGLITFSSESLWHNCRGRWKAYAYCKWRPESTISMNTTDYMELYPFNNRMYLNADQTTSWEQKTGTFIGRRAHDVYLDSEKNWYDQVITLRDLDWDMKEDYLRFCYSHNVVVIPTPTTDWIPDANTIELGTYSYLMASTRNVLYTNSTSNAFFVGPASTFTNMNLSQFYDGTPVTSNDYLVLITYNQHVTGSSGNNIAFYIGNTSDSNYYWYIASSNFSTGWNRTLLKIGTALVQGTPSWASIDWARYQFIMAQGTSGLGGVFDYAAIIRADPEDPTQYNVFQGLTTDGAHYNLTESNIRSVLRSHGGEPVICQTALTPSYSFDTWLRSAVQDFNLETQFVNLKANYGPSLSAYIDIVNYAILELTSGVLKLRGEFDGSTWSNYINCEAFSLFKNCNLRLSHNGDHWRGEFWINSSAETYRQVEYYQGPTTKLDFTAVYLGEGVTYTGHLINNVKLKRKGLMR